jgi:hypothetical protein
MKLAAMVAALSVVSGCAMTFQEHRPDRCTTSRTLPRMDLAFLGVEAGAAIAGDALRSGWGFRAHPTAGPIVIGVALAAGVMQAASAGKGFRWVDECAQRPAATATR